MKNFSWLWFWLSLILTFTVVLSACGPPGITHMPRGPSILAEPHWGAQTKTSGCQNNGPLQDAACTPGDIFPNVTWRDVCTPGYARSVRDVPQSIKNKAYAGYGITRRLPGQYEVDHLVSLQLGGSNDLSNLWPEAASPKPGFHEKNRVENYLRDQVCKANITLKAAQVAIASNWVTVYNNMPNKNAPNGDLSPD